MDEKYWTLTSWKEMAWIDRHEDKKVSFDEEENDEKYEEREKKKARKKEEEN